MPSANTAPDMSVLLGIVLTPFVRCLEIDNLLALFLRPIAVHLLHDAYFKGRSSMAARYWFGLIYMRLCPTRLVKPPARDGGRAGDY